MAGKIMQLDVANEFSDSPAGRYVSDGKYSGEVFREQKLIPNLNKFTKIILDFSGVDGYGSSFLEEAFGGLIRKTRMTKQQFEAKFEIKTSNDPTLLPEIMQYVSDAIIELNAFKS